jgi:hypothetical protein
MHATNTANLLLSIIRIICTEEHKCKHRSERDARINHTGGGCKFGIGLNWLTVNKNGLRSVAYPGFFWGVQQIQ